MNSVVVRDIAREIREIETRINSRETINFKITIRALTGMHGATFMCVDAFVNGANVFSVSTGESLQSLIEAIRDVGRKFTDDVVDIVASYCGHEQEQKRLAEEQPLGHRLNQVTVATGEGARKPVVDMPWQSQI